MPEIPEDPIQCFQTDAFQDARTAFLRRYRRSMGFADILSYLQKPSGTLRRFLSLARLFLQANGGNVEFTIGSSGIHPELEESKPVLQVFIHRHLWLPEHSTLPRISPLKVPDATTEKILSTIDPELCIAAYHFAFSQAYRNLYQQYDLALTGTSTGTMDSAPVLYDHMTQLQDQYNLMALHRNR